MKIKTNIRKRKMNRMELSKLSKDMLIEILLKANKWEYYKIVVKDHEFYVKCRSKDEVTKIMTENDDIKSCIIDYWKTFKNHYDLDILYNNITNEIIFYSYHGGGTPAKEWRSITIDEDFKSIVSSRFSELLDKWLFWEPEEGISIHKINMFS